MVLQIWLSTSSDLHNDAIRDLRALGCHISVINNCQTLDKETRATGLSKSASEGVLFMWAASCPGMCLLPSPAQSAALTSSMLRRTYSTLISNLKGSSRLDQVCWLGYLAHAKISIACCSMLPAGLNHETCQHGCRWWPGQGVHPLRGALSLMSATRARTSCLARRPRAPRWEVCCISKIDPRAILCTA